MLTATRGRCALLLLSVALAGASAACTVQRAHTLPFDGADNKGVVYSVPKTYLSVTVQYAFVRDELRPAAPMAHVQALGKFTPVLVPDEKSTFIVKTDGLGNDLMLLSSVCFRFNNGTLESVDANAVDRTGQIIEEFGTVAVNVAKAAAKGDGTPQEKAILAAERRIDEIYAAIAAASTEPVGAGRSGSTLEVLQRELEATRKLIGELREPIDPPVRTHLATFSIMLDPDFPKRQTSDYLEYEIKPPQLFAEVPEDNMDVVTVRIYDNQRRKLIDSLHEGRRPAEVGGIIYRQPAALLTKVFAGTEDDDRHEIYSDLIPYVQFAPPAVAVIESKVLAAKHTTLVLDNHTGGLVSYGVAQDSPVENAAKTSAAVSSDVVQAQNADESHGGGKGGSGNIRGTLTFESGTPASTQGSGGTGSKNGSSGAKNK